MDPSNNLQTSHGSHIQKLKIEIVYIVNLDFIVSTNNNNLIFRPMVCLFRIIKKIILYDLNYISYCVFQQVKQYGININLDINYTSIT